MIMKQQALEALTVLLRRRGSIQPELTPADWDALYLVRAYIEQAEPSGFVRVPVEPTREMVEAGCDVDAKAIATEDNRQLFSAAGVPLRKDFSTAGQELRIRYRAMIAAAPKEPTKRQP